MASSDHDHAIEVGMAFLVWQAWLVVVLEPENAADSSGRDGAGRYGPGGGTGSLRGEFVAPKGRG